MLGSQACWCAVTAAKALERDDPESISSYEARAGNGRQTSGNRYEEGRGGLESDTVIGEYAMGPLVSPVDVCLHNVHVIIFLSLSLFLSLTLSLSDGVSFNASSSCASITTGGALPEYTDAVVIVQDVSLTEGGKRLKVPMKVYKELAPGTDVRQVGTDTKKDEVVLNRTR